MSIPDALEYRAAFWGQVWQLGEERFWEQRSPSDERNVIAAQMWRDLLEPVRELFDTDATCDLTNTCQSYPNTASFIQYFPNDPRYTPDLIGEGYNAPAWYFATLAAQVAYGAFAGDIITTIDRLPAGSLPDILPASGLPRFRVHVFGEGTIRLHLRNMVQGSLIQITTDDDTFSVQFVDVSKDIFSVPPETEPEIVIDRQITGPGAHHIDCIVVSWVNDQFPFLYHGGGLISVELCGVIPNPQADNFMLRVTDGILEQYDISTDTWEAVDDGYRFISTVPPTITGNTVLEALQNLLSGLEDQNVITDGTGFQNDNGLEVIADFILTANLSSFTFTDIPQTFRHLYIIAEARSARTADSVDSLLVVLNGDDSSSNYYNAHDNVNIGNGVQDQGANAGVNKGNIYRAIVTNTTSNTRYGHAEIRIEDYARTDRVKQIIYHGIQQAGAWNRTDGAIEWGVSNAGITSISFETNSGSNLMAGSRFTLYGLRGQEPPV